MSWAKLDDSVYDHPKVREAGDRAFGRWARMLAYCSKHTTNGVIPEFVLREVAQDDQDVLLRIGLLDVTTRGIEIHDFLKYNPSRAEVESARASKAERQRRWRNQSRRVSSASRETVYKPITGDAAPSHPIPSPPMSEKSRAKGASSTAATATPATTTPDTATAVRSHTHVRARGRR